MAIDGVTLSCCRYDLENSIIGAKVDKAYQPRSDFLTLRLRYQKENPVLLSAIDPRQSRIHLTDVKFSNPQEPPVFAMVLRKHLYNGKIKKIKQPGMERMLIIKVQNNNQIYSLIAEIMGKYSNVILVNEENIVLDAMKRIPPEKDANRTLVPNVKYEPPPPQDKTNPYELTTKKWGKLLSNNFSELTYRAILNNVQGFGPEISKEIVFQADINLEKNYNDLTKGEKESLKKSLFSYLKRIKNEDYQPTLGVNENGDIKYQSAYPLYYKKDLQHKHFESTHKMFDYFYENHIVKKDRERKRKRLKDIINKYHEKNEEQQKIIRGKIKQSQEADKYKRRGELLKANLHRVNEGQEEIEVIDYYKEDQPEITIPLDSDITPAENVDKLFNKYNKLKKSRDHLVKELARFRHEEKYLSQVEHELEQAEALTELDEIEEELISEGYIQQKNQKKSIKKDKKSKPRKFFSSDGYQILVGRNNRQNDKLTKKISSKEDIWVHTKEIAGSHVIIRNHKPDENIPDSTIKEAAILAAYFSKARQSQNVPVDYTKIYDVNKPSGAKPGIVYYDNHKTLYVNPDKEEIKKIAKNEKPNHM